MFNFKNIKKVLTFRTEKKCAYLILKKNTAITGRTLKSPTTNKNYSFFAPLLKVLELIIHNSSTNGSR